VDFSRPYFTDDTKENWGIAVKKGNKTLLDKINAALIVLEKNGSLIRLKNKWLMQK
jgi:ABC-type amino acid transport substrate-binding protein